MVLIYTWSSNVGGSQINHQNVNTLPPGNYIVTVQDAAQCFSFNNYTITEPAVLTASVTNTGATCGNNDGTATATPAGGNSPYSYVWTGGQTTHKLPLDLRLGSRTVTVTDSKGCIILQHPTVTATTISPPDLYSECGYQNLFEKSYRVWEKPVVTNIDSFRIYREISSTFKQIGNVKYSALSEFTDNTTGVNPNITSYKYEISVLDVRYSKRAYSIS